MATRKVTPVGSLAWVTNERLTIQNLEYQDVEDIAYSVRNDMEWLNEHMASIFERNIFDMAEIMKTPGRLREKSPEKTPRTIRRQTKPLELREPSDSVFTNNTTIAQEITVKQNTPPTQPQPQPLPQLSTPRLPTPKYQSTPIGSPVKSSPQKQFSPIKVDSPAQSSIKEVDLRPPPIEASFPTQSFEDSGFFTASTLNSQVDHSQHKFSSSRDPAGSHVLVDLKSTTSDILNEGTTSRVSFSTAQEDVSIHRPSSPAEEVILVREKSPKQEGQSEELELEPLEQATPSLLQELPVRLALSPIKKLYDIPLEPRRSGRLVARISESDVSASPVRMINGPVSPIKTPIKADKEGIKDPGRVVESNTQYPTLPEPEQGPESKPEQESEPQELENLETVRPSQNKPDPSHGDDGVKSPPEPPVPEVSMLRKSSMNFASLPAREPLTNKKKSLGAKVIKESHLDQLKQNESQRANWKKANGKSLGGSSRSIIRKPEEDEKVEADAPELKVAGKRKSEGSSTRWRKISRGEDIVGVEVQETVKIPTKRGDDDSDAELRLHNKTSTQRLHDKIQQLGKLNARTARSFPASVPQPSLVYPDLSALGQDRLSTTSTKTPVQERAEPGAHPTSGGAVEAKSPTRPLFTHDQTDSAVLGGDTLNNGVAGKEILQPKSPRRPSLLRTQGQFGNISIGIGVDKPGSPNARSVMSPPLSPMKIVSYASINDVPQFAANGVSSPKKTPTTDNSLSAVKAHTSSMIKKAKEMWMKSSAASASAKVETLNSPPLRKWQGAESLQDVFRRDAAIKETGREAPPVFITQKEIEPTPGRQARNPKIHEEARAEVTATAPLLRPKTSYQKADDEAEIQEMIERQRRLEEILRQEKEDLKRMGVEKSLSHMETTPVEDEEPIRRDPSRSQFASAEPKRPPSRLQQRGMRFQKPEPKRTMGSTNDQPMAKPAPVSIKIGTASQREMQDQRRANTVGLSSGSALVAALKSSFEPAQPSVNPNSVHSQSLHTSSSNGSLKSVVSSNSNKQLRSLQSAASQRKKEQEDKERKATQKRDLERRRADGQKRQEEEQRRMQSQRQKATTPGPTSTSKSLARVQPQANLRQTSQEPEANRKPYGSLTKMPYAQNSIKRTLPQEPEEQSSRHVPGTSTYHQDGLKKRRTNDYEDRYEMPPPIRNSMAKKELVSKRSFAQSSTSSTSTSSNLKASSRVPQVESVKYSKDKIRFAGETPGPPISFKTPGTTRGKKGRIPATFKESPMYTSGESIELPEIPTDSEDEDEYPKEGEFHVPQWAESPELRALLQQQQTMDPAEIFGPMAKLDMEAIFKTEGKGLFRARTSSANWGGQDRLTQAEILADQEARRKMMETGKWTFPSGV